MGKTTTENIQSASNFHKDFIKRFESVALLQSAESNGVTIEGESPPSSTSPFRAVQLNDLSQEAI